MARNRIKSVLRSILPGYQTLNLDVPVEMKPRFGHGHPPHPGLFEIISRNREVYKEWLVKAMSHRESLLSIKNKIDTINLVEPVWNNGSISALDLIMLFTMIASGHPGTYIEIGSGYSTKTVFKAKRDYSLPTRIISIDRTARPEIEKISDSVINEEFEKTDQSLFTSLKKGDIIFVNSSHRIFPNSDATVFFMEVLPYLPSGVKVHFHNVYLPYDYPQEMCDKYYSEQYGLAFFLMANPEKYKTIAPNYFISEDEELKLLLKPFWEHSTMPELERHGSSFWIEIA